MPEMPEIKAHAERPAENWMGAELTAFRPLHLTALKTYAPQPKEAYGRSLTGTGASICTSISETTTSRSRSFSISCRAAECGPTRSRPRSREAAWRGGVLPTAAR